MAAAVALTLSGPAATLADETPAAPVGDPAGLAPDAAILLRQGGTVYYVAVPAPG
jgi:hypothetical protein